MKKIALLPLLSFTILFLWTPETTVAGPSTAAAPTPQAPVVELLDPRLAGAFIALQAQPLQPGLWTRVQWQDAHGGWHDIEGWQGTFNPDQRVLWYVGPEHLGSGPFRWLVYQQPGGRLLGVSQPFHLPSRGGELLHVTLALTDSERHDFDITDTLDASVAQIPAEESDAPPVTPWLRAHPVWDAVDGWSWPETATLRLTIDDPATAAAPDFEMQMPGTINPDLGSVWFEFTGVYDLKAGDEVTMSDGVSTRHLTVSALAINAVDAGADTLSGRAAAGTVVRLPAPPPPDKALFVTADNTGQWQADFHDIGFDLAPGMMVIAEEHEADGDLTSFEWPIPTLLSENVAAGRPVVVVTNGADDARENPGMEPADITDRRIDYLPAGDAQSDGVVGYVNDDYNEPMVITVTIDLEGMYDVMSIRYTTGNVLAAATWNADRMTTPFGATPTNPGRLDKGAWTVHNGRAVLSSVTVVLEKTRVSYATDWLFIGEIEVYGVPALP